MDPEVKFNEFVSNAKQNPQAKVYVELSDVGSQYKLVYSYKLETKRTASSKSSTNLFPKTKPIPTPMVYTQ